MLPATSCSRFPPTLLERRALNLSSSSTVFLPAVITSGPAVVGHHLLKESVFEEQCLRLKKPQISWAKNLNAALRRDRWQLPSRQAPWGLSLLKSLSLHFDVFQQLYEINSNKLNLLQGQTIWMKTIALGAISHLELSDLRGREAAAFCCKAPLVGYIIGICWGSQKRLC